jgi:hypothetical protein
VPYVLLALAALAALAAVNRPWRPTPADGAQATPADG